MIRKAMGTIVKEACKSKNDVEAIAFLRANCNSQPFKTVFWLWVTDKVRFDLPPGKPPYEHKNDDYDPGAEEEILYMEARKLINGTDHGVLRHQHKMKLEQWFINLLKDLHPDDADLLCWVKDKAFPIGLNKNIIMKAFPSIKDLDSTC